MTRRPSRSIRDLREELEELRDGPPGDYSLEAWRAGEAPIPSWLLIRVGEELRRKRDHDHDHEGDQ